MPFGRVGLLNIRALSTVSGRRQQRPPRDGLFLLLTTLPVIS